MPNKEEQLKKLITLNDNPAVAIFDELGKIAETLKSVIIAIKASKSDNVAVSNLSDINLDLTPLEASFKALQEHIANIVDSIKNIKGVDLKNIENLLSEISKKKTEKTEIDLSSLLEMTEVLDKMVFAIRAIAQKEDAPQIDNSEVLGQILGAIPAVENFDQNSFLLSIEKILDKTLRAGGGGANMSKVEALLTSILENVNTHVHGETPTGTIDGNNKVFTLANAPNPPGSLELNYSGGGFRFPNGFDYTLSGLTITYVIAPREGTRHLANYHK